MPAACTFIEYVVIQWEDFAEGPGAESKYGVFPGEYICALPYHIPLGKIHFLHSHHKSFIKLRIKEYRGNYGSKIYNEKFSFFYNTGYDYSNCHSQPMNSVKG